MYALVVALSMAMAACHGLAFVRRRRGWLVGFVLSGTALIYTHNWGLFVLAGSAVALAPMLRSGRVPWRDAAARLRRDHAALPAVAAHVPLPGVAHGGAVVGPTVARRPPRGPRRPRRRPGPGRGDPARRRQWHGGRLDGEPPGQRPQRAALGRGGHRARAARHRGGRDPAGVRRLAGRPGVDDPLLRGHHRAAAAPGGDDARAGRHARPADRGAAGRPVAASADGSAQQQERRPPGRAPARRPGCARRPRRLHAARAGRR